jgi:curved DNA-binding protein CbpA
MKVFEGNHRTRPVKHEPPAEHLCEYPDCDQNGPHRAPRAPNDLRSYRWFCLGHVREYNRAWNFFEGWSRSDIEHFQRDDVTGHRPTWPVYIKRPMHEEMDDLENMFHNFSRDWFGGKKQHNGEKNGHGGHGGRGKKRPTGDIDLERACATLGLKPEFDRIKLRSRYMELAKKHHPDMNGGSKKSEELLKSINQAYTYLLNQVT